MKHLRSVPLIIVAACCVLSIEAIFAQVPGAPKPSTIEFKTLEEAVKTLRAKPGVTFRNQDGWLIAEDLAVFTVWLLTPVGHPAYPSMVKRTLINGADGAYFETNTRCLASKEVCDKYFGGK